MHRFSHRFIWAPTAATGGGGAWQWPFLTLLRLCQRGMARLIDRSGQLLLESVLQAAGHLLQLFDRCQQAGLGRQGQLLQTWSYWDGTRSAGERRPLQSGDQRSAWAFGPAWPPSAHSRDANQLIQIAGRS